MKPIRVLHFYKASMPESYGGVEKFIDTLCKAGRATGVENSVLTLSNAPKRNPIKMNGYTIHQVKQHFFFASTGFSLSAFRKFRELAEQADIIHYHFPNPFADMLHILCHIKKPSIVTYHSDIIKQRTLLHLYSPLKRRFLSSVNHIVATSPNYYVSSDVLQDYSRKVSVVPIGIDINSYPKADEKRLTYWRQKLKGPFFLFIGALRYYKGLHVALDAIAGTNIRVAIAGINGIEKELKAYAASLKLDNIDFLGFVTDEDKVALLTLCYGFIFPSHLRSEAFGISLLEAAAFGKPMISCEIGTGTSFINTANETGLVIAPGSADALRDAMQYLLDNPETASNMGMKARERAEKLFTAEKQAQSYKELYQKLHRHRIM